MLRKHNSVPSTVITQCTTLHKAVQCILSPPTTDSLLDLVPTNTDPLLNRQLPDGLLGSGETQAIEGLITTVSSLSSHDWHAAREDYTNSVLFSCWQFVILQLQMSTQMITWWRELLNIMILDVPTTNSSSASNYSPMSCTFVHSSATDQHTSSE